MKLICISEVKLAVAIPGAKVPQIMERVTAIREEQRKDGLFYELAEYPPILIANKNFIFIFAAPAFAIADGPDETERLSAWQEKQIAKMDALFEGLAEAMPEVELSETAQARLWNRIEQSLNTPL